MATEMTLSGIDYLKQRKIEIDRLLDQYLPPEDEFPQALHRAMRYSVLAGGKRIRPILCLTAYEAFGGSDKKVINPAACSLEFSGNNGYGVAEGVENVAFVSSAAEGAGRIDL